MFAANNEVMVRQSNLIFYMHRQRNLFLCCCDANWYFSFLIHWMKINFCWSQNCITFLQGFNAGSCKLCRDMRWNFGILGFIKFEICCVYVSLPSSVWKFLGDNWRKNGCTLQIVAFVIQCFLLLLTDWLSELLFLLHCIFYSAQPNLELEFGKRFQLT